MASGGGASEGRLPRGILPKAAPPPPPLCLLWPLPLKRSREAFLCTTSSRHFSNSCNIPVNDKTFLWNPEILGREAGGSLDSAKSYRFCFAARPRRALTMALAGGKDWLCQSAQHPP